MWWLASVRSSVSVPCAKTNRDPAVLRGNYMTRAPVVLICKINLSTLKMFCLSLFNVSVVLSNSVLQHFTWWLVMILVSLLASSWSRVGSRYTTGSDMQLFCKHTNRDASSSECVCVSLIVRHFNACVSLLYYLDQCPFNGTKHLHIPLCSGRILQVKSPPVKVQRILKTKKKRKLKEVFTVKWVQLPTSLALPWICRQCREHGRVHHLAASPGSTGPKGKQ